MVQVLESVVAWVPALAGFARTLARQLPPATMSFVPQVLATRVKFVASVMDGAEHPVAGLFPELLNVKLIGAEFDPTLMVPKLLDIGFTVRTTSIPFTRRELLTVWLFPVLSAHVKERLDWITPRALGWVVTFTLQL